MMIKTLDYLSYDIVVAAATAIAVLLALLETPLEKARMIPAMLKEIITAGGMNTRFDRAHFKSYGDSTLQFEVVYYVLDADYNIYMDSQQQINVSLLHHFRRHGIVFAYPTRTLYVSGAENAAEAFSPNMAGLAVN